MDKAWETAAQCLPETVRQSLRKNDASSYIEEIRLRVGKPPALRFGGRERALPLPVLTEEQLRDTLSRAAQYSLHSYTESIRQGFVTLRGGHRLGLCGTAVEEQGRVLTVRGVSSLNLRVARQPVIDWTVPLLQEERVSSALIAAPPGFGKTTLLRALIRQLANAGRTVGVADERGEIAAVWQGVPQYDLGDSVDVLSFCSKENAARLLLRSMSPTVLAFDEITSRADAAAVMHCMGCGAAVLASIHAGREQSALCRALRREFDLFITITLQKGKRCYAAEPGKGTGQC